MNLAIYRRAFPGLACFFFFAWAAALGAQSKPPLAPVRPVTDDYFGTQVTDPYRWMETSKDELLAYMKAQNVVTQEALAPFATQNAALVAELTKLSSAIPAISSVERAKDFYFYRELDPGKSVAVLMTRPAVGGDARVLLDPAQFATASKHAAIDYAVPSWDGQYVLVGVSLGGSEDSTLYILETASGKQLGEAISRAQQADPSWADDNRSFYYSRLQVMAPGAPAAAKYENMRVYYHVLGADPEKDKAVFGPDITQDPILPKLGYVHVRHLPGTNLLIACQVTGVVETDACWVRSSESEPWRPMIRHEDGVMSWTAHGSRIYAITKTGAINGRIVSFDAGRETFSQAKVFLPESDLILSSRDNSSVDATSDGLYLTAIRNGLSVIERFPYEKPGTPIAIQLPAAGSAYVAGADPNKPDPLIVFTNWTTPSLIYRYDPGHNHLTDTGLQLPNPADFSKITSKEVEVVSADGTRVPVSIIYRKDIPLDGRNPTLVHAYGAYGLSESPRFSTALLPWLERGGVDVVAHVRGGGEKGEAWHLAGMKQTKQHTIDDFVACVQYLIANHYSSPAHLAIEGTSAGGIAVGGFLTQHPELIQAVLYRVGITDILRSEQRSTGASNAAEYGSVKVEPEFRAMYAISPYAHVKDGAAYPAVLLETGANDPRVTSWMLTKMTARLQVANSSANPILLRVDFDAGHGIGSNRTQLLKLIADEYTFLGWQLGMSGFVAGTAAGK